MSRLRIVFTALLAVSALAVLAVPASASVPAANAKFCKAAAKIGNSGSSGQPPRPGQDRPQGLPVKAAEVRTAKVKKADAQHHQAASV